MSLQQVLNRLAFLALSLSCKITNKHPSPRQVYPNIEKWALDQEIQLIHVKVDAPKEDSVPLTWHKVIQILTIMIDSTNLPLYVHCLDGTTVSMVTLACLRKVCQFPALSQLLLTRISIPYSRVNGAARGMEFV